MNKNTKQSKAKRVSAFFVGGAVAILTAATLTAAAPQATVELGFAKNFAVLAGAGVTNTGPSVINGDLGTYPTPAVTGFGPGVVNGTTHAGDTAAQNGQASLTIAYNDARDRTKGAVLLDSPELGGRTLTPGLYKSPSTAFAINGALYLAGKGVYIFQMGSGLVVTDYASVVLTGGALAADVFWQAGPSATLGTYSVFKGTIMADQSITMATGASMDGRALARIASVTLDTNTVTLPPKPGKGPKK